MKHGGNAVDGLWLRARFVGAAFLFAGLGSGFIFNPAEKLALAAGVGPSFGLLERLSFDPAATAASPADQSLIEFPDFVLPALCSVPALLAFLRWPITCSRHPELRTAIERAALVVNVSAAVSPVKGAVRGAPSF